MSPIIKGISLLTANIELRLTDAFIYSVDDRRDAAQVDAQIVSKLAGIITPSKIDIVSDLWAQISIRSNSDVRRRFLFVVGRPILEPNWQCGIKLDIRKTGCVV